MHGWVPCIPRFPSPNVPPADQLIGAHCPLPMIPCTLQCAPCRTAQPLRTVQAMHDRSQRHSVTVSHHMSHSRSHFPTTDDSTTASSQHRDVHERPGGSTFSPMTYDVHERPCSYLQVGPPRTLARSSRVAFVAWRPLRWLSMMPLARLGGAMPWPKGRGPCPRLGA